MYSDNQNPIPEAAYEAGARICAATCTLSSFVLLRVSALCSGDANLWFLRSFHLCALQQHVARHAVRARVRWLCLLLGNPWPDSDLLLACVAWFRCRWRLGAIQTDFAFRCSTEQLARAVRHAIVVRESTVLT